jgi:hypothetical protein
VCRVEGVLVAQKDFNAAKHMELDVPNLQVIKAAQSLTSKGFLKTQFSWNCAPFSPFCVHREATC